MTIKERLIVVRDREAGNIIEKVDTMEEAEALIAQYEAEDRKEGNYTADFYEAAEIGLDDYMSQTVKVRYEVDYTDPNTGATSAIDNITAPEGYTADAYIKDCEENADQEYIDMIKAGEITLIRI